MEGRLRTQYKDDTNLNARIQLHKRFSTSMVPWTQWVFDQFQLPSQARILELGCGPGTLWADNKQRIPSGWVINLTDFSDGMLRAAQRNLGTDSRQFSFDRVNAQDIPDDDDVYDVVIANHMLYHIPDRAQALAEIKRVLIPGGRLYASTVGIRHMGEMWTLLHPYVPNLQKRFTRASSSFTLENAASQLVQVFDDVQRVDFEDSLEVTDAEAVIAYLRSSTSMVQFDFAEAAEDHVRDQVNAEIVKRGTFHITKASGLFTAF